MHEMPEDWQDKMADLLEEWDFTWDSGDMPNPAVLARSSGKFCRWPEWLLNYRHPNRQAINGMKIKKRTGDI